jgi:hypothetical protein
LGDFIVTAFEEVAPGELEALHVAELVGGKLRPCGRTHRPAEPHALAGAGPPTTTVIRQGHSREAAASLLGQILWTSPQRHHPRRGVREVRIVD